MFPRLSRDVSFIHLEDNEEVDRLGYKINAVPSAIKESTSSKIEVVFVFYSLFLNLTAITISDSSSINQQPAQGVLRHHSTVSGSAPATPKGMQQVLKMDG